MSIAFAALISLTQSTHILPPSFQFKAPSRPFKARTRFDGITEGPFSEFFYKCPSVRNIGKRSAKYTLHIMKKGWQHFSYLVAPKTKRPDGAICPSRSSASVGAVSSLRAAGALERQKTPKDQSNGAKGRKYRDGNNRLR